ncbi:non-specific lipid-transfer protein 1-like [Cornus florida]|uniref:non-specific lipid-transfer protein 1-like n=1 Tax=Cornus florida TaxID=4283 RepID=UPI00289E74A9|nr:non-specific lipid-transfer protein 1-like [Cornus florida]
MKGVVISVMVVLVMIQLMAEPGQAISCGQVDASLAPCVPYLTSGGNPTPECCNGVKSIKGMAATPTDKQTACKCVKDAANRYANLKDDAAQALPAKCNVQMDIPISRTTNCNK